MFSFDGPSRIISVDFGVDEFTTGEVYSRWKEWAMTDSQWLPAFRSVGGDPTVGGATVPSYLFLLNGWRIRPYDDDHHLTVSFNLYVQGGGSPFLPTVGDHTVTISNLLSDVPGAEVGSEWDRIHADHMVEGSTGEALEQARVAALNAMALSA